MVRGNKEMDEIIYNGCIKYRNDYDLLSKPEQEKIYNEAKKWFDIFNKNKWISVNDRLPEYKAQAGGSQFVSVLACVNNMVCETLYCDGEWTFLNVKTDKVTHWMYLPEGV